MINERLERLRHEMRAERIDAIIFPSSDPHNSEYPPLHWQSRQWISGFTGSAGTVVVTQDDAMLWTDSRYYLQAADQLQGSTFQLMKDGLSETPTIIQWLKRKMSAAHGTTVAIDGMVMTYNDLQDLAREMRTIGVGVRTNYDAMRMIWKDRPQVPSHDVYSIPEELAGESVSSKLRRIRHAMSEELCEAHIVTDLMSVAWTLNLRGHDVSMTPVFVSYLIVFADTAVLFTDGVLSADALREMSGVGVTVRSYGDFLSFVSSISDKRIMCDSTTMSYTLYNMLRENAVDRPSPVFMLKAVKNEKEIEGFRRCMLRDGIALVKFLRWLKPAVQAGGQTEISVSDKLEDCRKEAPEYRDLSFATICGYQSHGAIVHYSATKETDSPLKAEGLLLLDSGAQYVDGTTDITRTIALGPVTDEMRRAYTLVLKANIALASVRFPEGTNGTQLDAVARSVIWSGGMNYLHGTGHGVGWCLAVHEGPQSIRMEWRPAPVLTGMTVTDEPGIYLSGRFGVRTENTMLVEKACQTEFGTFCQLTPLTLCPIDKAPIMMDMLTDAEKAWLDNYHERVRAALLPLLSDAEDREWLVGATSALKT